MEHSSATRAGPIGQSWAIVLAAGNGTRLSSLTRDTTGASVPKQFCSLDGALRLVNEGALWNSFIVVWSSWRRTSADRSGSFAS